MHSKQDILVIADDLGLDQAVNEGIFFAFRNGLIGGASLMANGEAFDDVIRRLKDLPNANIGIHLVLVDEKPLTQIKLPKNHKIFFIKYILGLINLKAIEMEMNAQIDKCLAAGVKPTFINSHQHLHLLPGMMDIVIELAKKYGIPLIRIINEPFHGQGRSFRKIQSVFLKFLSFLAKRKIQKAGLECNDFFVGFINAGNINIDDVKYAKNLSKKYPDKVIEFGCHPGYENEELRNKYKRWGNYNWEKELNLLKDITFIGVVKTNKGC